MQKIKHILLILLAVVALASCTSSKPVRSRYQTLQQRAQVSLTIDEHKYNMASVVKVWKNELIVVSIMPMLGIEMVRIEATPECLWVVDKMNKRYAEINYKEVHELTQSNLTYKMLQDLLVRRASKKDKISMSFEKGNHKLELECAFSHREYNTLTAPQPMNKTRYKKVTLRDILPL